METVSMNIEAGKTAIRVLSTFKEELQQTAQQLQQSGGELMSSWYGTSKTQFDDVWAQFTSALTSHMQGLHDLTMQLAKEVQQMEEATRVFGG